MSATTSAGGLRYAVDENPPHPLAAALALQVVVLILAGITLTPVVVLRAAGGEALASLDWVVFAALLVSGLTTMLQARPIGTVGAGHVLFMGTAGSFIAICITAIQVGGLALMASLVVVSSLIQFWFSNNLGLLRRIVTPTVGGTVVMLIAVTVFPICFKMLGDVPAELKSATPWAAPLTAGATFLVIMVISLFGSGAFRLWGPLLGVVIGCLVAQPLGLLDLAPLAAKPWIGTPQAQWPGLDLDFGIDFWVLLPSFAVVTIVGAIETYGDGIAIQRVSHRGQRPLDFRVVQGAVKADGVGNLLSGLLATMPNTTYSTSSAAVELTGVAARRVGLYGGALLVAFAFSPKLSGLIQAIPGPVAAAYIMILLVLLFVHGLRLVVEDGLSYEQGLVVGLAFWLGSGFQNGLIYADELPHWAKSLLGNGMTSGGIIALLLTLALALRQRAGQRLELPAAVGAVPRLHDYLARQAKSAGWDRAALLRLQLVGEEAFMFLAERRTGAGAEARRIRVQGRPLGERIELELVAAPGEVNLEGLTWRLDDKQPPSAEEVGLRLLKGLVVELHHQQFNEQEYLSLVVESSPLGER